MRHLSLIVPEKISSENKGPSVGDDHIKLTSRDDGPEIVFLRRGDSAAQGGTLTVFPNDFRPGGTFNRSRSSNLTTRKVYTPYQIAVSLEDEPTNEDIYGITELGVRKFMRTKFSDPTLSSDTRGGQYKNGRVFSFGGDLYYLCEHRISLGTNFATVPKIFKYNESNDKFEFYHMFPDPVSVYRPMSRDLVQKGSPDYFTFKGLLHVGYRVTNKDARRNEVLIWRQSELGQWTKLATIPISKSFNNVDVTRLKVRIAASPDAIMVVYYAIETFDRGASQRRERHDMRSYVSYDGVNFTSKSRSFETISIDENDEFLAGSDFSNMAYHFIPRHEYNGDGNFLVGFNVNFALYYDDMMASFVILKGGDPTGRVDPITGVTVLTGNDTWLMGIKTTDGDYSSWENCVNFEMSPSNTGLLPPKESINFKSPVSNASLDQNTFRLRIIDIDVVPGVQANVLAITWGEYEGHNKRAGSCLTEFEFVSVEHIESGTDDYHYDVGSKAHPEWSFLVRRFDPDACGLFGGGTYSTTNSAATAVTSISLCKWREQVVVSSFFRDQVQFTLFSQWQNVSESASYQYSYSTTFGPVTRFSHVSQTGGTYSTSNMNYQFPAGAGSIVMANSGPLLTPSLLEVDVPKDLFRLNLKTRFVVSVVDGSNAEVIKVRLKAQTENVIVSISLEIGEIFVYRNVGGSDILSATWPVDVTDWSDPYEFIFGSEGARVWLYYRKVGTLKFFLAGEVTLATTGTTLGPSSLVLVGAIGGTSDVVFYDIQVGTYNTAHRATFGGSTKFRTAELGNRDINGPNCPFINTSEKPFELMDGSLVSLRGEPHLLTGEPFIYKFINTETSNTPFSLVDGLSDRLFDMTLDHSSSDHCHCYKPVALPPTDLSYGYQCLFLKEPRIFDAFSLINAFGFHCFDIIIGTHDGTAWSDIIGTAKYKLTRQELTIVEVVGASFTVEDVFDQGQIIGYCVMKYSKLSETYEATFQVKRNFQRLIVLDRDIGVFDSHHEMHLFFTSASYQLPETLFEMSNKATHIALRVFGVPSSDLIGLGEFIVGQSFELSEYANQLSASMEGDVTVTDGDYGLLFNKGATYRPAIESFTIDASVRYGGMELTNMLRQAQRDELLMSLVEQRSSGANWTWPVVKGDVSYGAIDYLQDVNINLIAQNYFAKKTRKDRFLPPTLTLSFNPEFEVGVITTITATAVDPAGGTLTYEWFVGGVKMMESTFELDMVVDNQKTTESVRCVVTSSISKLSDTSFAYLFSRTIPQVESVALSGILNPIVINEPDYLVTITLTLSSGSDFGTNYVRGSLSLLKDSGQIDRDTGEPIYVSDFFIDLACSFTPTNEVIWDGFGSSVDLKFFTDEINVDFELISDPQVSELAMVYEDEFGNRQVTLLNVIV